MSIKTYLDLRGCQVFYRSRELAFLLGFQIFSMWDSNTNSSERGEQGFPFSDLRAFLGDRDFGSWALTMSVSDGPSKHVEPSLHRPNCSDPSGPLREAHQALYFITFSCPLHPTGPSAFRTKDQWGDDPSVRV